VAGLTVVIFYDSSRALQPPSLHARLISIYEFNHVCRYDRRHGQGLRVDWPHLIAQIISFGIVALLLQRFAYKPVIDMLEERRKRIAEGLANAEKIKSELARAEAQRQEILGQANTQATRLIEEARAAAAKVQEAETQKAIAAAEQIIAKAREAAAQDHAACWLNCARKSAGWWFKPPRR